MKKIWFYDFSIGRICIGAEGNVITDVTLECVDGIEEKTPLIEKTACELREYFEGKRKEFDIPIEISGSEFSEKVWNELRNIPYGKTCSYKDVATAIGKPGAERPVGGANKKNKIMILIPCHRVIRKNGKIGGYNHGIEIKKALLEIEKEH